MVRTKVDIKAFKLTRSASMVKHTGVIFTIVATKAGSEHELLGSWIHEVTGGTGQENQTASKSVLIRRRRPTPKDVFETQEDITNFELDLTDAVALNRFESLFDYDHSYNFVSNNCRDHVLTFIGRLQSQGYRINEAAFSFINNIQSNDKAIAAIAIGAVAVGGTLLWNWWNSDKTSESEALGLLPSSSASSSSLSVSDRKSSALVPSHDGQEDQETRSNSPYNVTISAPSERVLSIVSWSGHSLPMASEIMQAISTKMPELGHIVAVDQNIVEPCFWTMWRPAIEITLDQPIASLIASKVPDLDLI